MKTLMMINRLPDDYTKLGKKTKREREIHILFFQHMNWTHTVFGESRGYISFFTFIHIFIILMIFFFLFCFSDWHLFIRLFMPRFFSFFLPPIKYQPTRQNILSLLLLLVSKVTCIVVVAVVFWLKQQQTNKKKHYLNVTSQRRKKAKNYNDIL